jgi:D-amino-acid dehydrogenase
LRAVVVGGGVVGVTTAYFLARAGVEVVLVEKEHDIAPESSRTNAGLISPGHSFAWASPAAPRLLVRSLLGRESSIGLRLPPELRLVPWGLRFLRECTPHRARTNSLVKLRLARFSQRALETLIEAENIECSYRRGGVLFLYRTSAEYDAGKSKMALMRSNGQEMRELTSSEIAEVEPALAPATGTYAGALLGLTDATADSLSFSRALLERCRDHGVEIRLGVAASGIAVNGGKVEGVLADKELIGADVVVLAAGAYTPQIDVPGARPVPVYPARGFAMDVPIRDVERAPVLGGLDERRLVAWSTVDSVVRLAAVAQFAGFDRRIDRSARDTITETGRELFGDALDWEQSEVRVGFRPMTPDGPPIIGPSRIEGLFYNTGHGHMGWTMACGSAIILRDLVVDGRTSIDTAGLTVRSTRS